MKRILAAALAALLSFSTFAATLTPIQLLNPAGSTSGQFIASTGATTAPAWVTPSLSTLTGIVPITKGGTGATTASAALTAMGGVTAAQATGRLLNIQVFTASGTYTPTTGATKAKVRVMSPGGGSGGNAATSTGQISMSSAGNAGAYGEIWIASGLTTQTVTIGAVGAAGSATPTAGGTGGTTSFGALIACTGGVGGGVGAATANTTSFAAYPGSAASSCSGTGTFLVSGSGAPGEKGIYVGATPSFIAPGNGGSTMWGSGGQGRTLTPSAGTGYGAGAGAFFLNPSSAAAAGAAGAPAIVIVEEFN